MVEYEVLKPPFFHKHIDSASIHVNISLWEISNQLKVSNEERPTQRNNKKSKKKISKVVPYKGIR